MPKQPTEVKPGQMYVDVDPRSVGVGELTVLEVWGAHAIVQRLTKKTQIRCDRLLAPVSRSRGYKYLGKKR